MERRHDARGATRGADSRTSETALEQSCARAFASARIVERARIVLLAADGMQDKQIAPELGITPEKAARWRNRFLDGGLAALEKDAPRPGRRRTITRPTREGWWK